MGALSERAVLVLMFMLLSGILGKAAVCAAELVVEQIVSSELVSFVCAANWAAAVKFWVKLCLKAEYPPEIGTGNRIRDVIDVLGPALVDEGGHVKGTAEFKLCPTPDSFIESFPFPVKGTTGTLLGFTPAFCHDIVKVEINRSSNSTARYQE